MIGVRNVRSKDRVKDELGRREWASENGMR